MACCRPICLKWTLFGFSIFFLLLGIVLIFFTDDIVNAVKKQELNLGSEHTTEYGFWKETPIPMYLGFYLFNWTNWKEVVASDWTVKPALQELGPYTWKEKHIRKNVIFNDNHTLTYKTQRIWHYDQEKSVGSLDDLVTTINPILVTVGNIVKYKHPIVRMGLNFFLKEKGTTFTVTKSVREFIFEGYEDPMLDLLKKVHLRHINIPFSRFGWFAERNMSVDYDGVYNMFDGVDDVRTLGRFTAWNYNTSNGIYPGECGKIKGTSGELWYPVLDDDEIEIFSPDICSTLSLRRHGTYEKFGLEAHQYQGDARTLDNGTAYPEMACFSPAEVLPTGLRNVSQCKYGAPAFFSYPHFYLADPIYGDSVDGMNPNESEHKIVVSIEPETGIPLKASVAAQLNLRIERIDRITLLENVKKTVFLPVLWFKQYADINEDLANLAKLLVILPSVGQNTGYGVVGLGCLMMFVFLFLTWRKFWKGREEERLLNQDAF